MKYARYTQKQLQLVENSMGELGEVERVFVRDSLTGAGAFAGLFDGHGGERTSPMPLVAGGTPVSSTELLISSAFGRGEMRLRILV